MAQIEDVDQENVLDNQENERNEQDIDTISQEDDITVAMMRLCWSKTRRTTWGNST
jgi:hypothetical protein